MIDMSVKEIEDHNKEMWDDIGIIADSIITLALKHKLPVSYDLGERKPLAFRQGMNFPDCNV